MDLRNATPADVEEIRAVAAASLAASYADVFDEDAREAAVEHLYDPDELAGKLTDDHSHFVVAVDDGDVVGFAETYRDEADEPVGRIDWLHVHPDHRGAGVGEQLLRRAETVLLDAGAARLEGRVLRAHEAGAEFYGDHGYEAAGERSLELDGETYVERTLVHTPEGAAGDRELVGTVEHDGRTLYVAYDESSRGSDAPFFVAYSDEARENRYSWVCGNCDSAVTAMDATGRATCEECGNERKSTRWDAAYL